MIIRRDNAPQISVQEVIPILDSKNGDKTVKNPPDNNNCAKSCLDVNIGKVFERLFGSANLNSNKPEATTPVEFPNSTNPFSNQKSSKTKYEKKAIHKIFHKRPKIVSKNIIVRFFITMDKFKLAIAENISKSVDNIPISLWRI